MKVEDMSPQQRRTEIAEILGRALRRMQERAVALQKQDDSEAPPKIHRETSMFTNAGGAHE